MDENTIVLIMILGFGFVFILIGINAPKIETKNKTIKPSEKVKEETVKKEVIDKKVVKEEIKKEAVITQPIKQENKIFNLRNLGWVSFAVAMFLLFSQNNNKSDYAVGALGVSSETLRNDDDFQVAVLSIIEDYCWVVLNENHDSGYGKKIECYK